MKPALKTFAFAVGQGRSVSPSPCRSSARAFTMIEIAISIAIVAFALVAIIGVLPIGLNVQRDNREETIINADANYILQAIRNGTTNLDIFTRNIDLIQISNSVGQGAAAVQPTYNGMQNPVIGTNTGTTPEMLLSFLTTPKYVRKTPGQETVNYVTARVRAFSGPLADRGDSPKARDLAFKYLLSCEIIPFDAVPQSVVGAENAKYASTVSPTDRISRMQSNNLYEVRLEFRWPALDYDNPAEPGRHGNGRLVYRSLISGSITNYPMVINAAYTASRFVPQVYFNPLPKP